MFRTMRVADSLGLKERLVTAYELKDTDNAISRIQRNDALRAASGIDFRSMYSIRFPGRRGMIAAALAVVVALTFAIPSGSKAEAARMEVLAREIGKQSEKLDKAKKELAKNPALSPEKLKAVNKKVDELLKEMKSVDTGAEAVKALARSKHELESLKNKGNYSDLAKLGKNLSGNPSAKDLGQALQNGSLTDMKQRLEELKRKLKDMDGAERKELSESLKKASQELTGSQKLSESLANAGSAVASGDQNAVGSSFSGLDNTISESYQNGNQSSAASQQSMNEAIDKMEASIDDAKQQLSGEADFDSGKNNGNQVNSGQQGSGGQGDSSGNGQSGSDGKSNKGGGGAGNSSSNKDLGYSGEESGSGSRQPGDKRIQDFESIYVPKRLGGDNNRSQVKGNKNLSGQSQWSEADGAPVEKGSTIPYDKVFGEYKSEAMSSLQDSSVPPGMKDVVRDYFSSLE